jgi:hypothetical protein
MVASTDALRSSNMVSVIIPTYNRCRLLEEAIASVRQQSDSRWELLIIDDFSTDGTEKVARDYCDRDASVRYMLNAGRKGATGARNTGIENAQGDYLIFLDSDDLLDRECVSKRLAFVSAHPGYDFYCFPTEVFHETPGDMGSLWNYLNTADSDLIRFLRQDMPWHTSGVLWTRRFIVGMGGWDPDLGCWQDWDLHVRALLQDGRSYIKAPDQETSIDSYYRFQSDELRISASEPEARAARTKVGLISKHLDCIVATCDRRVRWEYARLVFRVAGSFVSTVDVDRGAEFFRSSVRKLGYTRSFAYFWGQLLRWRFSGDRPRAARRIARVALRAIPDQLSLNHRSGTFLTARYH